MKYLAPERILYGIFLAFAFTLTNTCFAGEQEDQPPKLPTEVTLTNGVTLHQATPLRWAKDKVTLKHTGGVDPIRFSNMADADRKTFEEARDYYLQRQSERDEEARNVSVTLTGQAFVQTNAEGPVKLGALRVYAFPIYALEAFKTYHDAINLPAPLASALTDAEGRFKLVVPGSDPFFVFAQGSRVFSDTTENYEWRITSDSIEDRDNVLLQNENMVEPPTDKEIVIAQ
jgi:hypothetical protein